MVSDEKLKEAKQFKNAMLVCGIITLPVGIGLIFLLMYYGMKNMIDKEIKNRNK